uniref:Proteasome subunit beta n=1 Tax=Phallusia mammillata TaxID=59560 RepID=A0A6F9DP48_9ASCI|nr:proteasome subunit beta type-2-like [Phallusia mammillata]
MEFSIGFEGDGFVLLAADTAASHSIVMFKQDQDKMVSLGKNTVMSVVGEPGDACQFSEYVQKNLQLYKMRNGYEVSTRGMANFTRKILAEALRKGPYFVHLLIGGCDPEEGCSLFFLDYLASSIQVPFAAHGYGSYFTLSLLDRWHRKNLTKDEAVELLKRCMAELKKRFIVTLPAVTIRIIDKDGVHTLPLLKEEDYVTK